MSRQIYKEGTVTKRERLSLVAELLLEGALRNMESEQEKVERTVQYKAKSRSPIVRDSQIIGLQIQPNQ